MKRYHDQFPAAPQALVSGISAACQIPSIVDARVGRDGSIYLKIFENPDFEVSKEQLDDIAFFCDALPEEVTIERSLDEREPALVVVSGSSFDFSPQFYVTGMPGLEDSEEGIEAHAALALARRD